MVLRAAPEKAAPNFHDTKERSDEPKDQRSKKGHCSSGGKVFNRRYFQKPFWQVEHWTLFYR